MLIVRNPKNWTLTISINSSKEKGKINLKIVKIHKKKDESFISLELHLLLLHVMNFAHFMDIAHMFGLAAEEAFSFRDE